MPGHGALTSPQGLVPLGSPILIEPTLRRPESAGSGTIVTLPALLPSANPRILSKLSSSNTITLASPTLPLKLTCTLSSLEMISNAASKSPISPSGSNKISTSMLSPGSMLIGNSADTENESWLAPEILRPVTSRISSSPSLVIVKALV